MPLSVSMTHDTSGQGTKGQSFTVPTSTGLSTGSYKLKIITTCLGTGTTNTSGIQKTRLKLRDFVNNDETSSSPNCFSGTLLATSGYGSVTGAVTPQRGLPESTFVFDELVPLTVGNKYVIEIELGPLAVYVKIPGPYNNGQAYDINGLNIGKERDLPFRIEGIKF
jgi:hypothetical protein